MNCESSYCGRAGLNSYRTDRNCYRRPSCSLNGDEGYLSRRTSSRSPAESSDETHEEYSDDMVAETGSETDDLEIDEEDCVYIGSRRRTFSLSTVMEVDQKMRRAELDMATIKQRMAAEKSDLEDVLCDTKVKLRTLYDEKADLENRLCDTELKLERKTHYIEKLAHYIEKLAASLDNCDKEIDCLQRRISEQSLTIIDQCHVVDDYKRQVWQQQQKLNDQRTFQEKARKEIDSIESTIIKSLRDENKHLEEELQDAKMRLGKMEKETSTNSKNWQLKVREKENEISKLVGDLEKQTTDYERKLNAFQMPFHWNKVVKKEDKHTDVAKRNINSKIDKLEKDIKELSKENKRLKEELSCEKENAKRSKNQWDKRDTELRRINKSQKQELQALQERTKLLEQQLQNKHQQKSQLQVDSETSKENVSAEIRRKYKSLEESSSKTRKDLERCCREKKNMEDKLTRQRDKIHRLEEETGRQKGDMQQLINSRLEEIERLKATNDELTRQINDFSRQKTGYSSPSANDDLREQFEATKEQLRNALKDRNEKLQEKIRLQEDFEAYKENVSAENKREYKSIDEIARKTRKDLERCHQEKKKLEDELAQERVKVQSLDEDVRRQKSDLQLQIKSQLREIEMLKATNNKLTRQLDDFSKQKRDYSSLTGNDDLRRQLEATKEQLRNALKDCNEKLQEKNRLQEDFEAYKENMSAENKREYKSIDEIARKTRKDLERCHQEKKKLEDELAQERVKVQSLDEDVRRQKSDLQLQIKSQLREIEMLKATNNKLTRQLDDFSKQKRGYSSPTGNDDLRRQLEATKEQLRTALKDRDEAQTRLSRAMGDRLTDNNPNIADLSDKNRPTKLSERYQELYDNQWTDAFEIIDRNYNNEEKTIASLKTLLTRAMEFCKAEAVRQLKQVEEVFAKGARIPKEMVKPLKDYRKALAEQYGEGLYKDYVRHLSRSHSEEDSLALQVPAFVKECFDICWLMAVQDPPVVLGPEVHMGTSFNKDHYKAYTKSGERVRFTVWPVLLLHEHGPVLCKGVAQGN